LRAPHELSEGGVTTLPPALQNSAELRHRAVNEQVCEFVAPLGLEVAPVIRQVEEPVHALPLEQAPGKPTKYVELLQAELRRHLGQAALDVEAILLRLG
jgi:hypothetical protein